MIRPLFGSLRYWPLAVLLQALICTPLLAQSQTPIPAPAETNPPGYLIVLGRSFDRNKIIAYSATLPPIYAETGGRYIGQGRPGAGVNCLFGLCEGRSAIVAFWPDQKGIEAFWWGEAYRKVIRLRDGAGVFTVVGVRGTAGVAPYTSSGALLIATASSTTEPSGSTAWIDAASRAGARLLAPFSNASLVALEGDPLYSRVAMLSFESKEKRDQFATSDETKTFIKSAPPMSLVSMIAIDAPVPPASASPTPAAPK